MAGFRDYIFIHSIQSVIVATVPAQSYIDKLGLNSSEPPQFKAEFAEFTDR